MLVRTCNKEFLKDLNNALEKTLGIVMEFPVAIDPFEYDVLETVKFKLVDRTVKVAIKIQHAKSGSIYTGDWQYILGNGNPTTDWVINDETYYDEF